MRQDYRSRLYWASCDGVLDPNEMVLLQIFVLLQTWEERKNS
ncbi:MAG: hypothetical protein WC966_07465 [Bradymonadales bacterium]